MPLPFPLIKAPEPYCTVSDLREEGILPAEASDDRLKALIYEASRTIDHLTGWFFAPLDFDLWMDGRGTPSIEPPVPPIKVDHIIINGSRIYPTTQNTTIIGAPVTPGFDAPRITLNYRIFPKGEHNIIISGLWGYTEPDGTPNGQTPPTIRRACMLLVLRNLYPLGSDTSKDARNAWRIIEERTRDQSYKLDRISGTGSLTGDPEIDSILYQYRRPEPLGAV